MYKASGNIDGYVILTKVANKTNVYTIRLSEYSNRYLTADVRGTVLNVLGELLPEVLNSSGNLLK